MARSSAAKKRVSYTKNVGSQGNANPNVQALPRTVQSQNLTAIQGSQWPANLPTDKPYPDMPKVSDTKPLLQQYGASGVAIFSGIITSEEYNSDFFWRDGIKIYEQMLRNDGQIAAVRDMVELPIRRATWTVEPFSDDPRDVEIASFVESCLFHDMSYQTTEGRTLYQKWDDILRHILMHLWYGFMTFEVNWKVEDGWVKWANWTPLIPRTVWRWWVGEDNELVGIQQWTFKNYSYQFINIPAEKLLLFVNRQEGGNLEGVSALRQAYKDWFYKVQYEKIQAIGIERNAVVPPVIKLPENYTEHDVQVAQMIAQNMRANELMGVTIPNTWDVEFPRNQQRYAANALEAIQYHDTMIARRMLCQFLDLGSKETGSYALADTQVQTFLSALQTTAGYCEDVINCDGIPRLVDYNYDHVEGYPKLKSSRLQADIKVISDALKAVLGQNALLTPYPELQSWYADQLGIPTPPANDNPITQANPTKPTNSAQPEQPEQTTKDNPGTKQATGSPVDDGGNVGNMLREMTEQVTLLRESFTAIDAVERGDAHLKLMNPYHKPPGPGGGEFDTKGGGGGTSGGGHESGGSKRGRSGGGGSVAHAEAHAAMAREQEAIKGLHAELAHERAGGNHDAGTRNDVMARISRHEYNMRQMQHAIGEKPAYKTKMTDAQFRKEFARVHGELTDSAGFAEIRGMQARFKAEHGMSAKEFSDRMNAMRESGDRGEHPYRLHMEEDEERLYQNAPHFWNGHQYDYVELARVGSGSRVDEGERLKTAARAAMNKSGSHEAERQGESVHERAAREQQRLGLPREVEPNAKGPSDLKPIPGEHLGIKPGEGLSVAHLKSIYGEHQLGAALHDYPMRELAHAAKDELGIQHPGANKSELISRMTSQATEGRYSANFGHTEASGRSTRSRSTSTDDRIPRLEARMTKAESAHSAEKTAHAETKRQLKQAQQELARVQRENESLRAKVEGTKRSSSKTSKEEKELTTQQKINQQERQISLKQQSGHYDKFPATRAHDEEHLTQLKAQRSAEREAAKAGRSRSSGKSTENRFQRAVKDDNLRVINHNVAHKFDPYAHPDAHFLHQQYGSHQLHAALQRYPHSSLKETARAMGVKSGRTKEETVNKIADEQIARDGEITGGEQP